MDIYKSEGMRISIYTFKGEKEYLRGDVIISEAISGLTGMDCTVIKYWVFGLTKS